MIGKISKVNYKWHKHYRALNQSAFEMIYGPEIKSIPDKTLKNLVLKNAYNALAQSTLQLRKFK